MISSIPLLFGTKPWWIRQGGARSSRGRIPIGHQKSVQWSVGSKNLRAGEGFLVEGVEEAEEGIEEEDIGEGETEHDAEKEDVTDGHSYPSSSSSKTMEERSIGGSFSLLKKKNFSHDVGEVS